MRRGEAVAAPGRGSRAAAACAPPPSRCCTAGAPRPCGSSCAIRSQASSRSSTARSCTRWRSSLRLGRVRSRVVLGRARSASASTTKSSCAALARSIALARPPAASSAGARAARAPTTVAGQPAVQRPRRERRHARRLHAAVERRVVGLEPLVVRAVARAVDVEQRDHQARALGSRPDAARRLDVLGAGLRLARARPSGPAG